MNTAVTAVAAAAVGTSKMQSWKGNSVVARVPAAVLQNSGMQSWAKSRSAHAASRADDLVSSGGASMQLVWADGAKTSRKRLAEVSSTQPSAATLRLFLPQSLAV